MADRGLNAAFIVVGSAVFTAAAAAADDEGRRLSCGEGKSAERYLF